ncbi:cell division protein FtsL [Hyphomonas sp. FCG-A18]|uniref:cell division protein FtsL n=1 Tax=Hyphomonas sp. FCG-A18 TaxID=3080019 RepID=UPI002B2F55E5|nr:cell division protein FtsL [Hyphomonas sp. FCG-A18]
MSKRAFLFGLAVIAVLIFSLYRAKYGARETVAEIAEIETQIAAAKQEQLSLRTEFIHRSRQEWIEEYARKQLGMVPARAEQFVRMVDLDSRVGPPVSRADPSEPVDREVRDDG